MEYLYKINDYKKDEIERFVIKVNNLFPVSLSKKQDLKTYANKLMNNATIIIATQQEEIIGMLAGYLNQEKAYISMLVVLPEHQGKNIGETLMRLFIQEAKKNKNILLHLYAVETNIGAMKLYEKLGFEKYIIENEERPNDVHLCLKMEDWNELFDYSNRLFFSWYCNKETQSNRGGLLVGTDIYKKEWVADAYNVDYFYQVSKVFDEENYTKDIDRIIEKHNITHILPLTDVEVDFYNKNRQHYINKNVCVCISPKETISICRNKKKQQEFIDKYVESIKTIPTKTLEEIKINPFCFPMVAKLTDGRSSQGLKYIYNQEDLNAVLKENNNKYIFQPKIEGNVITTDVVCNGTKCIAIAREELLRTLNGAGTSVKVFIDRELEKSCKELATSLGIKGCANFEFIKDENGEYHYIECNPRFSGGVEFSCIAGYDCIKNHINCFNENDNSIEDFELNKNIYIARKYEEYITKEE